MMQFLKYKHLYSLTIIKQEGHSFEFYTAMACFKFKIAMCHFHAHCPKSTQALGKNIVRRAYCYSDGPGDSTLCLCVVRK